MAIFHRVAVTDYESITGTSVHQHADRAVLVSRLTMSVRDKDSSMRNGTDDHDQAKKSSHACQSVETWTLIDSLLLDRLATVATMQTGRSWKSGGTQGAARTPDPREQIV